LIRLLARKKALEPSLTCPKRARKGVMKISGRYCPDLRMSSHVLYVVISLLLLIWEIHAAIASVEVVGGSGV